MIDCRNPIVLVTEKFILFRVITHGAGFPFAQGHPGQNRRFGSDLRQGKQQVPDILFRISFPVRQACQKSRFCNVWIRNVGNRAQLRVLLCVMLVKSRVKPAVIPHCRINNHKGILIPESLYDPDNRVDFLLGSQVPGINRVKGDSFLLPVISDGRQLVGKILACKVLKQRVRAEHRRRKNHGFNSHSGQNRQCDRQGTFSEAGDVLDCQYSFHSLSLRVYMICTGRKYTIILAIVK